MTGETQQQSKLSESHQRYPSLPGEVPVQVLWYKVQVSSLISIISACVWLYQSHGIM